MRGLTARAAVDLVAVDAVVDDRYWAKLAELVRPEFRVDLYRPAARSGQTLGTDAAGAGVGAGGLHRRPQPRPDQRLPRLGRVRGSTGITRQVLEGFISALVDLAPSYDTRSRILGTLRVFLDDARHQDLLALHPTAVVLEGDWPRRDEKLPRPIPEDAMAVLAAPESLALLPDNGVRALVVVLMGTGRRAGEAIRLPFDPVVIGPDGDPYLRYNDWKTHKEKEAVIPLDAETTAVIRAQQAAVRDQFPDGCRWLFPGFRHNRAGKHHITHGSLNAALHRWAATWTLYDLADPETGERPPLRLTAHRFRHTIATRMLNEDVPNWVVQRFLGHESPEMTARYAALHDTTLREHFDRFCHRVTAAGEVVQLIAEEPVAEGMALAERLRRARQTLPTATAPDPSRPTASTPTSATAAPSSPPTSPSCRSCAANANAPTPSPSSRRKKAATGGSNATNAI